MENFLIKCKKCGSEECTANLALGRGGHVHAYLDCPNCGEYEEIESKD